MKWTIDKSFDWCYGHRVWSQELNAEFTGADGACLACRHLHGHQGKLKVHLQGEALTRGMVTDFKHLGWFRTFIDDVLDHKFIMDITDPLVPHEVPDFIDYNFASGTHSNHTKILDLNKCKHYAEGYWMLNLDSLSGIQEQAVIEKYEGMVFVDFVPTSENLSAWLLGIARKKMAELDVEVVAVDFWETPKSHCKVEV